jgi:hypothetical protein
MMQLKQISVAVIAGNSDDRLTQREWSLFLEKLVDACADMGEVHFAGGPSTGAPIQNFCIAVELVGPASTESLKDKVADLARDFRQDSIAWIQSDSSDVLVKPS